MTGPPLFKTTKSPTAIGPDLFVLPIKTSLDLIYSWYQLMSTVILDIRIGILDTQDLKERSGFMGDDKKQGFDAAKVLAGMRNGERWAYCSPCKEWRPEWGGEHRAKDFVCALCLYNERPVCSAFINWKRCLLPHGHTDPHVSERCPFRFNNGVPGSPCERPAGHDGPHAQNPLHTSHNDPLKVAPEACAVTCDDGLRCERVLGHDGSHVTHNGEHSFPRPTSGDPHPAGYTGEAGVKHDQDKRDYSLLPWDALESVVRVLEFGERKYTRDGWKKVPDSTNRYRKALLRHVIAWCSGVEKDEETGESHLAHACCCILFLLGKRETP